jgi:class 3 adenylate cyclase
MAQAVEDPLAAGREAAQRYAWKDAYELLSAARGSGALLAKDLEDVADAAWWTGHLDEAIEFREQAYTAYGEAGNPRGAALIALKLADDFVGKGSMSVAQGWFGRAERLLADEPDSVEHGHLAIGRAFNAMIAGDIPQILEQADLALEIGKRFGDRELQAYSLVFRGRALVLKGEISQGLALLDEATAVALAGELKPFATGMIYCMMITSAQGLGDYRRAGEWTAEANRWCDRQDISGFPGVCRVHRAEALRLRGEWNEAEKHAIAACEEIGGYNFFIAAAGFYEIGEIRRRKGDFAAAEEAYRKAKEVGRDPQPGLALLRLAQGKTEAAATALKRSLAADDLDSSARARRLPAQVEIAIEAGDLRGARAAAEALEQITDAFQIDGKPPPAVSANAKLARGQILLAEGGADDAAVLFQEAMRLWAEVGAPYEEALARMHLGLALRRSGDEDEAREELRVARSVFERLGAVLDFQRAAELLGDATRRTFMFTDIVDSTKLVEVLGEDKWRKLLVWHDKKLRELIEEQGGEVIKQTGDGYFAAFQNPSAALEAAVSVQRALDAHEPIAPDVRIGLHTGGAFHREDDDYAGQGVHLAARIGALAGGGEILVSRESIDGGALRYGQSEPREAELRGIEEPVAIVSINWR